MEEKNSAVEKVEKITKTTQKPTQTEAEKANKRVQVAKQKKENKVKKSKQAKEKTTKQRQAKALKQKEKQEKKERLRAERQEKINALKAEKQTLKEQKQAQKAELKKLKEQNRAKAKQERAKHKAERSKRRASRGIGGWLAAVISLGTACLVLGTLLTINLMGGEISVSKSMVEFGYRQSFSELLEYSGSIDTNLSKALATTDSKEMQKRLILVSEESLLAEENLQRLPIKEENKYYTSKFINQLGDYAKYLNNKLIDGQTVTNEEKEILKRLYNTNKDLLQSLGEIDGEMASGKKINDLFKGDKSVGVKKLTELEDMATAFPQLIYDGPFSDGLRERTPKGISGSDYTADGAEKAFKSVFAKYDLNKVEVVGENNGIIPSYTVIAQDETGEQVFAQISKTGGKVLMFEYNKPCDSGELSQEECVKIGQGFLKNLGIDGMQAVWCETNEYMTTINFAYEQDGVIIYPDLIKLNICRGEGVVFGMEATHYYLNHTQREIANPTLSKAQAKLKVTDQMEIDGVRLALIPKGNDKEVLTYEISGEIDGEQYYIYINARSGAEEQMFKVVSTEQGNLLI